jgi:hypothetical protein
MVQVGRNTLANEEREVKIVDFIYLYYPNSKYTSIWPAYKGALDIYKNRSSEKWHGFKSWGMPLDIVVYFASSGR